MAAVTIFDISKFLQEDPLHQVQYMVMHGCESWTVKKAEHQRIDAFENCGVGEDC